MNRVATSSNLIPCKVGPVLAICNGAFGMTSAALPLVFKLLRLGVSVCSRDVSNKT